MVLLLDHYKTLWLRDGLGELTTVGPKVMQVQLAAGGKVEDHDVNM